MKEPDDDRRPGEPGEPDEVDEVDEAQQDWVRRVLAAAGTEPSEHLPEEVASRLDAVLSRLEAGKSPEHAETTRLDSRRKRWPGVLVAAAAVSVLGLGLGNLVAGPDAEQSTTAGVAEDRTAPEGGDSDAGDATSDSTGLRESDGPARLRSSSLAADLQRIAELSLARPVEESGGTWEGACVQPAADPGDAWLSVRLDGAPAVLVLRSPAGGRRTADIFTCDDDTTPVVSTTIDTD